NNRTFVNVPATGGPVRIGTVFVDPLGDLNRDGQVTTADITAMMSAMANTHSYLTAKNLTSQQWLQLADLNHDGRVSNADVQSLISMVANKAVAAVAKNQTATAVVPEPHSFALGVVALSALVVAYRLRGQL